MSAARRVVLIPELICSIISFLEISDLATWMRVSQDFFQTVGPLIWRDIPNIETLMQLVPGAVQKLAKILKSTPERLFTQSVSYLFLSIHQTNSFIRLSLLNRSY